jgi:hypothetical protein
MVVSRPGGSASRPNLGSVRPCRATSQRRRRGGRHSSQTAQHLTAGTVDAGASSERRRGWPWSIDLFHKKSVETDDQREPSE